MSASRAEAQRQAPRLLGSALDDKHIMLIEDDTIIFLVDGGIVFALTGTQRRMMCLSQTTGYAVYALSRVDDSRGQPRRIRDIAEQTGIPRAYLARIVSQLAHHGIIHSKRGYRGGIVLTQRAEEISLLQVVEAVEGKNWLGPCLLGLDRCEGFGSCPTQAMWKRLRDEVTGVLRTTTLADVIRCARGTQRGSTKALQPARERRGKPGRDVCGSGPDAESCGPSERPVGPIALKASRRQSRQGRASRTGEAGLGGLNANPPTARST